MPEQVQTLTSVFAERLLVVPDYQRPYSWLKRQIDDLWQDLDLMSSGTHYAGTLVLRNCGETRMDEAGNQMVISEVVDGQQRLTTCILLLDRVRRRLIALDQLGEPRALRVADRLGAQFCMSVIDGARVPKLRLAADSNSYWVETILGDHHAAQGETVLSQRRLASAVEQFDSLLGTLGTGSDTSKETDRLIELQRRVTSGLQLLVYPVKSNADVGTIFETLNDRGRPLSELEKVKNYLLYLARTLPAGRADHLAALINEKWAGIFKALVTLGGGAEDTLLRSHWLATEDPDPQRWTGASTVKNRYDLARYVPSSDRLVPLTLSEDPSFDQLDQEVSTYVRTLHDAAIYMRDALQSGARYDGFGANAEVVQIAASALRRSGVVAVFLPLLLASRLACGGDAMGYTDLVRGCEIFSARVYLIGRWRSDAGRNSLYRLAHDLWKTGSVADALISLEDLTRRYAPDSSIRSQMSDVEADWYHRPGHKYFLYELERSLLSPSEELPDLSHFTAAARDQRTSEHILPQNPRQHEWSTFSASERRRFGHSLANLLLTYDNREYSNKSFREKRGVVGQEAPCYLNGRLAQERSFALAFDEWTPHNLRIRAQTLTDFALARWPISDLDAADDSDALGSVGPTAELDRTESAVSAEDAMLLDGPGTD